MSSFVPHLIFGTIAGAIGSCVFPACGYTPSNLLFYGIPAVAGIVGALTPDMDIKSKSSQCLYILFAGLAFYFYYIDKVDYAFYTLLYAIIPQFFKHRGFIHSILFGLLSSGGLFYIFSNGTEGDNLVAGTIAMTYLLGFITHKMLDHDI